MTYDQITKEFDCSQEVAILGLSLFVIGLAVAPMILSPLSEVCNPLELCLQFSLTSDCSSTAADPFTLFRSSSSWSGLCSVPYHRTYKRCS